MPATTSHRRHLGQQRQRERGGQSRSAVAPACTPPPLRAFFGPPIGPPRRSRHTPPQDCTERERERERERREMSDLSASSGW